MLSDTDQFELSDHHHVSREFNSQNDGYSNNNATETVEPIKSWRSTGQFGSNNLRKKRIKPINANEGRSQHNSNLTTRHVMSDNASSSPIGGFGDDLRISKILRRLLGETNPHRAQELCDSLEVAIRSPANAAYICRSFEFLLDSMECLLKQCPEEILQQSSIILGIIGYINHHDFALYKSCITKCYQSCKELQKYIMLALRTTIKADATNLALVVYSDGILMVLKDYLENAERAEDFIAVSETIAAFAKNYTRSFENHFTDVVDIIVGWHLEADQTRALKQHCSKVLQSFSGFFLKALNFTLGLLGQFLEDLLVVGEELKEQKNSSSLQSKEKAEIRVGAFVGAFSSICKSLTTKNQFIIWSAGRQVIDETFRVTLELFAITLSAGVCSEDTVLQINDFLYLLFSHRYKPHPQQQLHVQELVKLQLQQLDNFTQLQTSSLVCLILTIIRQERSCLPCAMVSILFDANTKNSLCILHSTNDGKLYRLLLAIYHEVLMIKNVPLLQEAYKHMLVDIVKHMDMLAHDEHMLHLRATTKLNFYLSALSVLATQTSSIIGMYALNPSILELLVTTFRASHMPLWRKHELLHGALLQLLIMHCKKNHNFRTTSRILHCMSEEVNNSRTADHFALILQFVADILGQSQVLASENLVLVLDWLHILLVECEQHIHLLVANENFQQICVTLGQTALVEAMPTAKCMDILLKYGALNVLPHILHNWCLAIVQHLDGLDMQVQRSYVNLLNYMPMQILLKDGLYASHRIEKLNGLQHWYKASGLFAPLHSRYMKPFLEILEDNKSLALTLYEEFGKIFRNSWSLQLREKGLQYEGEVEKSFWLLGSWLQHEVARICVHNKLRTPLGKPQDTFVGIEAIIMKYARLLTREDSVQKSVSFEENICTQTKVRLLLGFLDGLEKQIYNAAEGTAFALLPVEKPAKTFFRLNINTCKSWFQRTRVGVNLLAAKCLQPQIVIRSAQGMLMKEQQPSESTILALANALLACQEADTLHGLYAWLKAKTGQRYVWLQHAAEQAAGRQELAANGYMAMLQDSHAKLSSLVEEFVQNQLLACYYHSGQWLQMTSMLVENASWTKLPNYRRPAHLKTLDALIFGPKAAYEEQLLLLAACETSCKALHTLTEWPEAIDANETVDFSYNETFKNMEDICMLHALQFHRGRQLCGPKQTLFDDIVPAVEQALRESLHYEQQSVIGDLLLLNKVAHAFVQENLNSSYFNCVQMQMPMVEDSGSSLLTKYLMWTQLFNVASRERGVPVQTPCRYFLDLAASARLEGNEVYCTALLQRCLQIKGYNQRLTEFSAALQNNTLMLNLIDGELVRLCSELTQCLWANSNTQIEAINLNATICNQMLEHMVMAPQPKQSAQMLLLLAEWITPRVGVANQHLEAINSMPLQRLLNNLPEVPVSDVHVSIPLAERAVGKLLNVSILQHSDVGEAWCAYGNWCYRWGKKLVETNSSSSGEMIRRGKLSDSELAAIRTILGDNVDPQALQQLTDGLENLQLHDGLEDIETSEISTMEIIESELRKIEVLAQRPVEQINSIIEIWRNAHKSAFAYYELATKSYFRYLALDSSCSRRDASFVTTTLRILRLVVKHAIGLQDTLEEGLKSTPLRPWRAIIPQLFSRLNHHEPYVRKSVAELLCRLAFDRPHLVIFPAVVGAQQELEQTDSEENKAKLSNCFGTLVNTLQQQAPDAVLHVQLLVKELKRVALLWEEYWMNSLAQLYAEYTPVFSAFELEVKKYGEKQLERLNAKYVLLMQHVLSDFQKIANCTAKTGETNYERNFQERFSELIENTIIALQKPLNLAKPSEHWLTIKQLYNVFQQRALRSTSSTFKVQDLSPVLAAMQNTAISMPGVDTFEREPIYIRAVENTVQVLPTKTRPKKLVFLGSDGRKYTYLFKGLEDLHLDERIMQFLSIANAMMARATGNSMTRDVSGFRAQHYSVIPLGPQSGLISWVDGVIPLFAIYKKWQQRETLLKQQQKERPNQGQGQQQNNVVAPTRPSEIFYNKLTPLLAEQNIKITSARKQWPLATLRRVLKELSEETPRDLLAKELWCHANNASDWRKSVRCYGKSVAVMSVIGYVIGLGDRHLDNVLIKLSTGEIVHIDYNVCFEKGKTLRVPEKVPFRMTPNIEEALGLTGIEGAFRLGCEHVLKTLRKERETLLTLLEAFVYDPLVDWTVGDDGSATATRTTSAHAAAQAMLALNTSENPKSSGKGVDAAVKSYDIIARKEDWQLTRQNLQTRLTEIAPQWTKYKDDMTMELKKVTNDIEELLRQREDIAISERQRDTIGKQLALIHELETLGTARGSHGLNTITERYALYKQHAVAFNNSKKRVQQLQLDYEHICKMYFDCVLWSRTPTQDFCALKGKFSQQPPSLPCNELNTLQAALEPYGHKQLYELYEFSRKEMDNTLVQQARSALHCQEYLVKYANVMKYYSRKRLEQHRCVKYAKWYGKLFDEKIEPTALSNDLELCMELEHKPVEMQAKTLALQYVQGMAERYNTLSYNLHSEMLELRELEAKSATADVSGFMNALQSFLCSNIEVHKVQVEASCCQLLTKTNEAFIQYEQNTFQQREHILLDQQLNYTHMVRTMCEIVFPKSMQTHEYEALKALHATLTAVVALRRALELLVPDVLLKLFVQSDVNAKHAAILSSMCVTPKNADEWLRNKDFDAYPEFIEFLNDLYGQFNDVEIKINELQSFEREVLSRASISLYTQFVNDRKTLCSLQDLRAEVIAKLFYVTREAAQALGSNDTTKVYEVSEICAPLIHYVHQLQRHFLLGLTSLFCHQMTANYCEELKNLTLDGGASLANATTCCQNLFIALQHEGALKSQHAVVFRNGKWLEHFTLVSSAHYWLNEQLLHDGQLPHQYAHIVEREHLISNVQASCQSLEVWKQTIAKIGDDIEKHTAAVLHLYEVELQLPPLTALHENIVQQREFAQTQQQTCFELMECANAMLRFEMLKTGNNSLVEADMLLKLVLQHWQESYGNWRQAGAAITPVELDIVQLLDPEGNVDQCWINNISGLLDDLSYNVQRQLGTMEREEQALQDGLQAAAVQFQLLLEAPIRVDSRHLLKSISKLDKHPRYAGGEIVALMARVRDLQHKLKGFYNKLGEMQVKLATRDYAEGDLMHLRMRVGELLCSIEERCNDFMQIVERTLHNVLSEAPKPSTATVDGQLNDDNFDASSSNPLDKKVNHKGGQQQKRNAYAVSVWKRIRMKLEGRDPDPNRRSSVSEQVDYIIREATNPDNLAVLYEGWTSWV